MTNQTPEQPDAAGQQRGIVLLPFLVRSRLPVACVGIVKALGLVPGDRLVSRTIDRGQPYVPNHSWTDTLWVESLDRFVQVILCVRFCGTRWVIADRHVRTSRDGKTWGEWRVDELADISAGFWHWLREFAADWDLVRM